MCVSLITVERKGPLVLPYSSYRFGLYLDLLVGHSLLADGVRATVMEIGAGWGGFAGLVKRKYNGVRYIILDIPSSSVFSMSLMHHLGFKRSFSLKSSGNQRKELEQLLCCIDFDVLFLSPSHLKLIPDSSVDVTINFDSLAEMTKDGIDSYVQHAARISHAFYHINRKRESARLLTPTIEKHMRWRKDDSIWYRNYSGQNNLQWRPTNRTTLNISRGDLGHRYVQELFVRKHCATDAGCATAWAKSQMRVNTGSTGTGPGIR